MFRIIGTYALPFKCFALVWLIYSVQLAHSDCPDPVEDPPQHVAEIWWLGARKTIAYPGQLLTPMAVVANNVSPVEDPENVWPCCADIEFQEGLGSGWLRPSIYSGPSDCRNQLWFIRVPAFDIAETSCTYAAYLHLRACSYEIKVIPYPLIDPRCRTSDMDHVNTYTGAQSVTDNDYENTDLTFTRDYNQMTLLRSYDARLSHRWRNPLGVGWQHNYNIHLEQIERVGSGGSVKGCLVHEGKATSVYRYVSGGNYMSRRRNHSRLKRTGNKWTLYKPNGEIYHFGKDGKIASIVDRNGRTTAFTYSGNYLSQVTGRDGHSLSFDYNSDSLLEWVSITENNNIKKFEYRYTPVTMVTHADTDTFDLLGCFHLTQVLQHYPTGNADSVISLYKYYYDDLLLVAKIFPHGVYTQSDTAWQGNYKKGDRLYIWYDTLGLAVYQEVINGDGDTLLTNDEVVYRSYTEYYDHPFSLPRSMDSAVTYVYQNTDAQGAHDPYDTSFTPQAPTSNYASTKRDYSRDAVGRTFYIETRPDAGSSSVTKIYKDKDFNDTLVISPNGDTTKYFYKTYALLDSIKYSPNPTKIIFPTGDSFLYYHHAPDANAPSFFLLDSTIDELQRKTEYYYDNNYNLDSIRYVSRYVAGVGTTTVTTDYTYSSVGNLIQIEDPRGNETHFSYAPNDTGPYLTQTRIDVSPSGQGNEDIITKYKYDIDIGKTDTVIYFRDYPGDSSFIYYTHDVMNRLKEIHYPDTTKDVHTYDKRGNLLKNETWKGSTRHFLIEYEYDARDQLTKVKEYKVAASVPLIYDSTLYKYNLNGDLVSFVNANDTTGISTAIEYSYDAGRLSKVEYPDTADDSLGYYKNGTLRFKRDRRGRVISHVYDKRQRLTRKRYFNSFAAYQAFPDSIPAETLAFSYDKVGNMVSMLDKSGTVSYSYDEMDGLDTLNCYQDVLVTYEYDKAGNRKKLKLVKASDTSIVYLEQNYPAYDEANRLDTIVAGADTFAFTYWDTGPVKEIIYPNGVTEQYLLTSRNFIDMITDSSGASQLFKFDYTYNEVGDRDTMDYYLKRPGQSALLGTMAYSYDDLRRLTTAQSPDHPYQQVTSYKYDKIGNRLLKMTRERENGTSIDVDTTTYTYNKRNNHLLTKQAPDEMPRSYSYDKNGNMVSCSYGTGSISLVYDFENKLVQFSRFASTLPPKCDTLWFNYCGLGRRISKIVRPDGQSPDTTSYAYDGMYAVCEFGGHLDLESKYVYANGLLLARYDAAGDTHYYHHDGLGSITGLTNENGGLEQLYFYDEFGNLLGSWGGVSNHYLYTGQEYDGAITKFYNLRARYLESTLGRFISEDPLFQTHTKLCPLLRPTYDPGGQNLYVYVSNNPINTIDPLGLRHAVRFPEDNWCTKCLRCRTDARTLYEDIKAVCDANLKDCLDACGRCIVPPVWERLPRLACRIKCYAIYMDCLVYANKRRAEKSLECEIYCQLCYLDFLPIPYKW